MHISQMRMNPSRRKIPNAILIFDDKEGIELYLSKDKEQRTAGQAA